MLVAGKIDALLTPHTLDELKPKEQRKLRPLIANPQQAEEEYLALTGFYPINHVVVIRDDSLKAVDGVGAAIFDAYAKAKAAAYKRRLGTTLLPWGQRYWTSMFDRFGGDPMQYGLTELNRKNVSTVGQFLYEQKKLISALGRRLTISARNAGPLCVTLPDVRCLTGSSKS